MQNIPQKIVDRLTHIFRHTPRKEEPVREKKWLLNPDDAPWYDRPDAFEILENRRKNERISDSDYELLRQWITDGYFVVKGTLNEIDIDAMQNELDSIWTAQEPIAGLLIQDLRREIDGPWFNLTHAEILSLDVEERLRIRDISNWRTHEYNHISKNAKKLHQNAELKRLASLVFGRSCYPGWAINFMYGSAQKLHQDTAVFHIYPPNYLIGAWMACEDISPDSGPLVIYPGSNKEPIYAGFDNYPQTNLKTASKETTQDYYEYLYKLSEKYEPHYFLGNKGDVLFWHAMVIHGGSTINNPRLTRKSFVIHYVPTGMDVQDQIKGPFNW
jgi:ectoine hydroxylase-related dioxygenase (phytanoyl-CoA dioxygenase family)